MKNKRGFSPITVLVGLTIGSMVSLVVMQAISQLASTLNRTTLKTQTDMAVVLGIKVLEQDLSSVCMPEYIHHEDKKEEKKEAAKEEKDDSKDNKQKDSKKDKKEFFKKAFFVKQSDKNVEQIICLSMYSIAKDHVVPKKIFYTLEADSKAQGNTYILYRQECSNLQAESADKDTQKFIVLKNIVSLECKMWARPLPKKEEKKETSEKKKEEKKEKEPYKSFTEWNSDDRNDKKKEEESKWPLLPDFVDIAVIMEQAKGQNVTYSTTIMTSVGFPELELTDVVPVVHEQPAKEKLSPQEQLDALTNGAEFSPSIPDKINKLKDK